MKWEVSVNEMTKPEAPTSDAEITILLMPGSASRPAAELRRMVNRIVLGLLRRLRKS
jgi:hypothetical protein